MEATTFRTARAVKAAASLLAVVIATLAARPGEALADGVSIPVILSADGDGTHLFIQGTNFGAAKAPKVTLGGGALPVSSYSPTAIVATLPAGLPSGTYFLVVSSFMLVRDSSGFPALFDVSLGAGGSTGATGPQGIQGPQGPAGVAGAPGVPGTNGTNGTDGKDGIPGTPGADGAPGQSVAGSSEPAGANCTYGGSRFASATGVSYACNGAPGSAGSDSGGPAFQVACFTGILGSAFPACCRMNTISGQASCRSFTSTLQSTAAADAFAAGADGHYSLSCHGPTANLNLATCCRADETGGVLCRRASDFELSSWQPAVVLF